MNRMEKKIVKEEGNKKRKKIKEDKWIEKKCY